MSRATVGQVLAADRQRHLVGRRAEMELGKAAIASDTVDPAVRHLHGPGGPGAHRHRRGSPGRCLRCRCTGCGWTVPRSDRQGPGSGCAARWQGAVHGSGDGEVAGVGVARSSVPVVALRGPESVDREDLDTVVGTVGLGPVLRTTPARNASPRASRMARSPVRSLVVTRVPALTSIATTAPSRRSTTRSTSAPSWVRQCPRPVSRPSRTAVSSPRR
jgi:hypothetical protein